MYIYIYIYIVSHAIYMRSMYTYICTHVYMYVCLRVCIYMYMLKTKAQDMAPGDLEAATRALHKLHGGEVLIKHSYGANKAPKFYTLTPNKAVIWP